MYLFEVSLAFVERKHSLMQEAKEEVRGSGTVQAEETFRPMEPWTTIQVSVLSAAN